MRDLPMASGFFVCDAVQLWSRMFALLVLEQLFVLDALILFHFNSQPLCLCSMVVIAIATGRSWIVLELALLVLGQLVFSDLLLFASRFPCSASMQFHHCMAIATW